VRLNRKQKAFHAGGNSSCRVYIWQHFPLYKQQCKNGDIPKNHHALPQPLWRELQEAKKNSKAMQQGKLDGMFKAIKAPAEFTREGVLQAVAWFVACNDQVHSMHRTQQSSSTDVRIDSPGTGSRK
jgi:hypothetical protein